MSDSIINLPDSSGTRLTGANRTQNRKGNIFPYEDDGESAVAPSTWDSISEALGTHQLIGKSGAGGMGSTRATSDSWSSAQKDNLDQGSWDVLEAFISLRSVPAAEMVPGESPSNLELDALRGDFRQAFQATLPQAIACPPSEILKLLFSLDSDYVTKKFTSDDNGEMADMYRGWGDSVAPFEDDPGEEDSL